MSTTSPTAVTGHHLPALNGLRGLAVLGVVAYHLQFGWASGGFLGVDLFFVLSGFLITSLLLEEWVPTRAIDLAAFWGRRAKRLLPALFLVALAIALYLIANASFAGVGANGLVDLTGLRGDAIATLLYVGNWHAIYVQQSYFGKLLNPSPLQHTWSLAIEEQFYLVWPPVLLLILRTAGRSWRRVGLTLAVIAGLVSAGLMALLFHPGADPTRIYYGTDTRAFDLMAGIVLAFLCAARPQPTARLTRALHVLAPVAAALLGVVWVVGGTSAGLPKDWMFDGGFLGCAVLAMMVLADARLFDRGPLGRALATAPLHFLGTISYGIYLWHWPVIVYLTNFRTGLSTTPLDITRVAVILVLSTASYYVVERPIRRASFKGWRRLCVAPVAGVAAALVLVVATVPAVADPITLAKTSGSNFPTGSSVAGAGGFGAQVPIRLPPGTAVSSAHPLRIVLLGDSVMRDASFGITAALDSTGKVDVRTNAIAGFGLVLSSVWRTAIPTIIRQAHPKLIIASWSWDQDGPSTPNALDQPVQYTALLKQFVRIALARGDGVAGVIFTQFPTIGNLPTTNPESSTVARRRAQGTVAWNNIAAQMPAAFPGRVMYLPLAGSLLLNGQFSTWLPPVNQPDAPANQWIRVRQLDNVHLCPDGSARYANALLSDVRAIFKLPPANPDWTVSGWIADPVFNTPPGNCPANHP